MEGARSPINTTTALPFAVQVLDICFGSLALVACTFGLILNALSVTYFYLHRKRLSNLIFFIMTITDMCTCVTIYPYAVSKLYNRQAMWLKDVFFCDGFGTLFFVTSRLSVFLVGLQSVVRTISLVFPFKKIKRATVIFTILLFLVIYSIYALIPYFWATKRFYFKGLSTCTYSPYQFLWGLMKKDPRIMKFLFQIPSQWIPFLFPCIPIITSCLASVVILQKAIKVRTAQQQGQSRISRKNKATITIILVTALYILFNMLYWVELSISVIAGDAVYRKIIHNKDPYYLIRTISLPINMVLNACCNPVIYFSRIEDLKFRYLKPERLNIRGVDLSLGSLTNYQGEVRARYLEQKGQDSSDR